MKSSDGRGVWTPLVTPFHGDGSLDWPAFDKLVARQLEAQIPVLVLASSFGEGATLSAHERLALIRRASARVRSGEKLAKPTFVLGATEAGHTASATELCKLYEDAGAHGVLGTFPLSAPFVERGLISHFKNMASGISIPVFVYFPDSLDDLRLSPSFLEDLFGLPGILGAYVKKHSPSLEAWFQNHPEQLLIQGEVECLSLSKPSQTKALNAVFSPLANVFPREIQALWSLGQGPEGSDTKQSQESFCGGRGSLEGFLQRLEDYPLVPALKACLHQRKCLSPHLRLPQAWLSEQSLGLLWSELNKVSFTHTEV